MQNNEEEPTRRRLSDTELDAIKDQLLESIYTDIGRSIVSKAIWIFGAICTALIVGWNNKEALKELLK